MTIGYYAIDKGELEYALKDRQFALSLQPIINIEEENFETLEVFIRWHHPLLGMLPPSLFMPRMAKEGLMQKMTNYIIHEAIHICKLSRTTGKSIGVNININMDELEDEETLTSLDQATYDMNNPENVCLEISSHILSRYAEKVGSDKYYPDQPPAPEELAYLQKLRFTLDKYADLGVTLALDTYDHILGAIDRAKILGLHAIKLSPKLIAQHNDNHDYLIKCYEKAKKEEIALIATGVENLGHMKTLINAKVNYVQGMFMCPPVYQKQLSSWYRDNLLEAKGITKILSHSASQLKEQHHKLEKQKQAFPEQTAISPPAAPCSNILDSTPSIDTPPREDTKNAFSQEVPETVTRPTKKLSFQSKGKVGNAKSAFGKKAF